MGRTGPVSPRPAGVRPSGNKWGRSRAAFAYAPQLHPLRPNLRPGRNANGEMTEWLMYYFLFSYFEKFSAFFYFRYKKIKLIKMPIHKEILTQKLPDLLEKLRGSPEGLVSRLT